MILLRRFPYKHHIKRLPIVNLHYNSFSSSTSKKKGLTFWQGINTIPNYITMSRIFASPFLAIAIVYDQKVIALAGCILAGFSDWLDGYIARKYNQKSVMGAFIDPMADKIIIGSLAIGLTMKGLIPIELTGLILTRDILLLGGGVYLRYLTKDKDSHFFDTTYSTKFEVTASSLSKFNTVLQFSLLTLTLSNFAFSNPPLPLLEPLWWVTGLTTVGSGLQYLRGAGLVFKK